MVSNKVRELQSRSIEEIALQFVDMALTTEISEKEAQNYHSLKGELLAIIGDKQENLIVRNFYFSILNTWVWKP